MMMSDNKLKPLDGQIVKSEEAPQKLPTQPLITMNRAFSMLRSKKALAATVGRTVTRYFLSKRQQEIDNLSGNLNTLPSHKMGHGAGKLLALWLGWSHPNHTLQKQVSILNQAIAKLDNNSVMPKEKAISRFLAAKVMIHLQGYKGTPLYYERYQDEAKTILNTLTVDKRYYRKDLFTGSPFKSEDIFVTAQRLLKALVPEADDSLFKSFTDHFFDIFKLECAEDYFTFLIALTHQQNNEAQFKDDLDEWFNAYKEFEQENLNKTKNRITQGITLFSGIQKQEWGLQAAGYLLNRLGNSDKKSLVLLPASKN